MERRGIASATSQHHADRLPNSKVANCFCRITPLRRACPSIEERVKNKFTRKLRISVNQQRDGVAIQTRQTRELTDGRRGL
jgi:hypothetical protein